VTPELTESVRKLLAGPPGEESSSKQVASRAIQACAQLSQHLSKLLGEKGVQTLFDRSVVLASKQFAWLAIAKANPGGSAGSTFALLGTLLEQQDLETATEAFVAILSTFLGLLGRFIGERLVERLLDEVWPSVFPHAVKETT
jgi:hypothetical protein